jgi:hypothetical protein
MAVIIPAFVSHLQAIYYSNNPIGKYSLIYYMFTITLIIRDLQALLASIPALVTVQFVSLTSYSG